MRARRLDAYAPWPLVGVAVLLVVAILVTPVLLTSGQPAPGSFTQARLIVDLVTGDATTHFYVRALGTTVRYSEVWFGMAHGFNWTGVTGVAGVPWSQLDWTSWTNETDVLSLALPSTDNPVAVNVSAYYVSPEGTALYGGVLAFFLASAGSSGETLYAASSTPGIAVALSTPVGNSTFPLTIDLTNEGPGP